MASKSTFFENVHVYVNGYTEPDSLTIKNMLAAHGGVWEQYNGRCNLALAPSIDEIATNGRDRLWLNHRALNIAFIDLIYSHVTHIVASQLPHNKIQKSLNATKPKIIVKPDWVVACVESGSSYSKVTRRVQFNDFTRAEASRTRLSANWDVIHTGCDLCCL